MKKIDWIILLFIIISSFFSLKDLFLPGFYTSHDGPHQIVRAYYYHQLLHQGQIPPRFVGGLNNGFGYPLFIFSYHLPWLLAEPFRLAGFSVIDSVKFVFLSGFILSGILMYFYQKRFFGRLAAFAGTFIYLYAPYRFSNIFVRSAIGDATAFIFAPLVFWTFDSFVSQKKINFRRLVIYALSLTALLLSHAMVFVLFSIGLFLYGLYRMFLTKNKITFILANLLGFIMFFAYSAFYLLPSYAERSYTRFSEVMSGTFNNLRFLELNKLIYSPWGYGTVDAREGAMSLSIGFAQLTAVILAALLIIYLLLVKPRRKTLFNGYLLIFMLIFLLSVFLILPVSREVWRIISRYVLIDFNWRILSLTVFSVSIITAALIKELKKKNTVLAAFIAFLLITTAVYANRNHLRINQSLDWTVDFFLKLEKTTNSFDEYNPKWVKQEYLTENAPKFTFSGNFNADLIEEKSHLRKLNITTNDAGLFTINTLYYPGWTVYDNGRKIDIDYQSRGLLEFPLSKGIHNIKVIFQRTTLRWVADLLTVSSLILTLGLYLRKKFYG